MSWKRSVLHWVDFIYQHWRWDITDLLYFITTVQVWRENCRIYFVYLEICLLLEELGATTHQLRASFVPGPADLPKPLPDYHVYQLLQSAIFV